MSLMIKHNGEILRINPDNTTVLEVSKNGGAFWTPRCRSNQFAFVDLMDNGDKILAQTDNGVWESKDGNFWIPKSR